ncbi:MAG: PEP-CTERM sorting domain-containing protein [Planctomycetota bacterium]
MNYIPRRATSAIVLLAAAALLSSTAAAETMTVATEFGVGDQVTLADIENGAGTIVVGDKEFSNFVYTNQPGTPSSEMVIVEGFENATTGEIGLIFNVAFAAGVIGPPVLDASLLFTVTILDPLMVFESASLTGTAIVPVLEGNSGVAAIEEVIVGEPGGEDFGLGIENNVLNGVQGPVSLFDEVVFGPGTNFTSLDITKDIFVGAGEFTGQLPDGQQDTFDRARLTTFTQTFTQRQIPEPSSVLLIMVGLAGATGCRRRKN